MKKRDVEIKKYDDHYQSQVVELILSIQKEEFNIPISIEEQPDLLNIPKFYQTGCGNFWVAISNDQVIGTIAIIDIGNQICALRKMFVDKNVRGKERGIAMSLLDTVVAWSQEHGIKEIYLGTTSSYLAAHRFYEKHGFNEIDKRLLPRAFPVMSVDSKFYKCDVNRASK